MALRLLAILAVVALTCLPAAQASAQAVPRTAPTTHVMIQSLPPAPTPQPAARPFDPEKATNAYLRRLSGAARARSDAYFEGGYLLLLVDAVYAVAVSALLLWLGISVAMRNIAQSITRWPSSELALSYRFGRNIAQAITRSRSLQVAIYVAMFVPLIVALTFPLSLYEQFIREHAYGLSNQSFPRWLGDFGIGFAITWAGAIVVLTPIYAVIRAAPRFWWAWASVVTVGFLFLDILITPVFIAPLFNHYSPLHDGPVKTDILRLAAANGVPANNVYEFDASRQTTRISANVSGLFGTTRISLNDNLLKGCSPAEIEAVLGHEMGHYVLDHGAVLITWFGLVFVVAFLFLDWGFKALVGIFGPIWSLRSIDDPAGLPMLYALLSVFLLLATPITNTISRTVESQADIFGLNAARQPDGFATVALKLGQYRKLDPSPLEEFLFYNHPSGRTRIFTAMRWKAAHLNDPDITAEPASPQ